MEKENYSRVAVVFIYKKENKYRCLNLWNALNSNLTEDWKLISTIDADTWLEILLNNSERNRTIQILDLEDRIEVPIKK